MALQALGAMWICLVDPDARKRSTCLPRARSFRTQNAVSVLLQRIDGLSVEATAKLDKEEIAKLLAFPTEVARAIG